MTGNDNERMTDSVNYIFIKELIIVHCKWALFARHVKACKGLSNSEKIKTWICETNIPWFYLAIMLTVSGLYKFVDEYFGSMTHVHKIYQVHLQLIQQARQL